MSNIAKVLPWAIAMLLIAIGEAYEVVAAKDAQTMYIVLPILAVIAIIGRSCIKCRNAKSAA